MRCTLFVLVALLCNALAYGQTTPVDHLKITLEPIGTEVNYDPLANPDIALDFSNDSVRITAVVKLSSTSDISDIHVSLGTTSGGTDLLDKAFVWDVTSLSDGTTYKRVGNDVFLCLGIFYGLSAVHLEVQTENGSGSLSNAATASF